MTSTKWLQQTASSLAPSTLKALVFHRGFHDVDDNLSSRRPFENTLLAFQIAWFSGFVHCECDVNLTSDGHLVLCHDRSFTRLAQPSSTYGTTDVTKLTLTEIQTILLKTGQRPALLIDVLRQAQSIGPGAKLIIEMKRSDPNAADALCCLLQEHASLCCHVAVIMSFDANIIHQCSKNMNMHMHMHMNMNMHPTPRPLCLLLTTANTKWIQYPAYFDITGPTDELERKLVRSDSRLDGVYIQYDVSMFLQKECKDTIKALSKKWIVGVWGGRKDPDNLMTTRLLLSYGASYVNTDMPESFCVGTSRL